MSVKTVLVGCGNMGHAMLAGWLASGQLAASDVLVVEPNEDLRARAAALGVATADSAAGLAVDAQPELVVLAVKPQVIREVTAQYARLGGGPSTFLSIAAGTPISAFETILGTHTPIVRCMPNTPAAIGKGMMVVYANGAVGERPLAAIKALLATSGAVATIDDEDLMDAVTAVSGSGPAYIFHFIECLTAAAIKVGLPEDTARLLAMQTVYGSANLAAESRETPATLRRQVTSPNGTTAAALDVLMGGERLETLVTEAVEAARRRAEELRG
ncbi:MAG: pyrroline-5-carboxylate reductase [Rhizobiaceae bacterium]|nr:pyrroline-5-carboxylate reductase [Rhizobiaceae bacterium]